MLDCTAFARLRTPRSSVAQLFKVCSSHGMQHMNSKRTGTTHAKWPAGRLPAILARDSPARFVELCRNAVAAIGKDHWLGLSRPWLKLCGSAFLIVSHRVCLAPNGWHQPFELRFQFPVYHL